MIIGIERVMNRKHHHRPQYHFIRPDSPDKYTYVMVFSSEDTFRCIVENPAVAVGDKIAILPSFCGQATFSFSVLFFSFLSCSGIFFS